MARKLAGINEIEKLTEELTWMGGDPQGMKSLLLEFEFTPKIIQIAINNVMKSHNCNSTYHSALECKRILELNKQATGTI